MGFLTFFIAVFVIIVFLVVQKRKNNRLFLESIKKELEELRKNVSELRAKNKIAEQKETSNRQMYDRLVERITIVEEKLGGAHVETKLSEYQKGVPVTPDTLTVVEISSHVQNDQLPHTTQLNPTIDTSIPLEKELLPDEIVAANEEQSIETAAMEQEDRNNKKSEEQYYNLNTVYINDVQSFADQKTTEDSIKQIEGALDRIGKIDEELSTTTLICKNEKTYESENNIKIKTEVPELKQHVRPESMFTNLWNKIERQVAENWTGILGTIILVLGIGFLGVYTAIRVNEVIRFLMINGCAAGFLGAYVILNKKEKWVKLSLWMRSASAAVFLFACLGAGGIPGLYWIKNPYIALIVLCIGIALNLYLSFIGSKQVFASLHVLLSLIALSIAPQNELLLVIAGLVSAFGIVLTIRERWVYHYLLSSTAFFVYHIFWYIESGLQNTGTPAADLTITGFFVSILVFGTALAVLYHRIYSNKLERINNTTQFMYLSTWIFFTLSIASHLYTVKWLSFPVIAVAVTAFTLGRISSRVKVQWLSTADTLVSMVYALIAITALSLLDINTFIVSFMIAVVMVLFVAFSIYVKENVLYKISIYGILLCTIGMILYMFIDNKYAVISVLLLALSVFAIAEYNRRFRNRWEYGTCVVIAQVSMIIGILSFYRWDGINTTIINTILAVELILVTGFMNYVKEQLWGRLGIVLQIVLFLILTSVLPDSTKWDIVPIIMLGAGLFILLDINKDTLGSIFYNAGKVVSLCAFITACFGLFLWFDNQYVIHGIVLCEIVAFTVWAYKKNKTRLIDISTVMLHLFSLYLIIRIFDHDPWNIVFLFVNSCTVFIFGITTTKDRIVNIFNVYSISAQVSCLVSIVCLNAFHFGHDIVITLLIIETCIYGLYIQRIKNQFLFQCAVSIVHMSTFAALVYGLIEYYGTNTALRYEIAIFYAVNALVLLAFNSYITIVNRSYLLFDRIASIQSKKIEMSVIAVSGATLLLGSACIIYNSTPLFLSIAIAGTLYMILHSKLQTNGLATGAVLLLFGIHILGWNHITKINGQNSVEPLIYAMILSGLAIMSMVFSKVQTLEKNIRWPGIYLMSITILLSTFKLLDPLSQILPGIVWLLLSLIIIELSRWCGNEKCPKKISAGNTGLHLLVSSYAFQIVFVLNHFTILQGSNPIIAGPIRESLISEAVAVAVFIVSLFRTPSLRVTNPFHKVYTILLLEMVLVFMITACIVTVHGIYVPLCWILYAIVSYLIGCHASKDFSRLKLYGILFYLVSIISVVIMYASAPRGMSEWIPGLVAILLQVVFLVVSIKRNLLDNLEVPAPLAFLKSCAGMINKFRNALLFYPLLVSIALFFYLNFTSSLLTVLWTAECFSIFVISIMLREQHFRYVALTGVGLCIVRLVFFDLKESTTITKALVFVGVGLLMLGMNILYSKYKDRLFDEQSKL
jgi:Predicted membrane protein (DUF2339)